MNLPLFSSSVGTRQLYMYDTLFHGTLLLGPWTGKYLIQGKGMGIEYKWTHDSFCKRKTWARWIYKNRKNILALGRFQQEEYYDCQHKNFSGPWFLCWSLAGGSTAQSTPMFGSCLRQNWDTFCTVSSLFALLCIIRPNWPWGGRRSRGRKQKRGRFKRSRRNMTNRKRPWSRKIKKTSKSPTIRSRRWIRKQ